jgi:hypothetical protein
VTSGIGARLGPLTEYQRNAVQAVTRHRNAYLIGGKGSGKSTAAAYSAAYLAYRLCPGLPGLAYAPTWQQVKDLTLRSWREVAPEGLYEIKSSGDKDTGPHISVLVPRPGRPPLRSVVYLRSGEAPKRVEGLSVAWSWGEEIQDCEELWDLSGDRIRRSDAPHRVRFGCGLPEQGWLEEVYEALADGRHDAETDSVWLRARTSDNATYLPPGYVEERRRSLTAEEARARLDGLFVSSADAVYSLFDRRTHVRSCPVDPSLPLVVGVDFNNRPMSAAMLQRHGPEWWVVGDIVEPGTTQEHAQRIVAWCAARGVPLSRVTVVPDASGKSLQHGGGSDHGLLRAAGLSLSVPASNPPIKDRDNAVLRLLAPAAGAPLLWLDPSCVKTIEAMSKLRHTGRDRSPYSHPADALGYPLHRYAPAAAPPPAPSPVSAPRPSSSSPWASRPGRRGTLL